MAGGQRHISCLHPCSTSNVALNTRTCAHGPLMGHPNWAGCDTNLTINQARKIIIQRVIQSRDNQGVLGKHAAEIRLISKQRLIDI
jgi:hypothetical protein